MNGMETYNGHVRSPNDAIILFEACRIGLLPRVQRRLSEKERQSIKSGSVFVWDEREAGMRRWTDGKSWSASRVSGSFLTYREMEGKRGGSSFDKTANRDGVQGHDGDSDGGPDGYRYKPDGLMKQSFSITTNTNQHLHLISYYSRQAGAVSNLMVPSQDPQLRRIRPEKGMYPESTVHEQSNIPPITRGPMEAPGYSHSPGQNHYARPPYSYAPWAPPSPMHTPPPHAHYGPYYSPHHPYGGQPPLHGMPYPPPQGYPHPHHSYDRAPPPLAGSALPPPGGHAYGHPPPLSYMGGYSYGNYPYPPPPSHGHPAAYGPSHPPPTYEPRPSSAESRPKEATSASKEARHDSASTVVSTAATSEKAAATKAGPPAPSNGSQKIPSIHTMLNEADQPPARKSSHSPGGASPPRPLQDIPSHKLGFEANRDMHTLRNLDKSTFKF